MANVGYVNEEVRKMYGIPYSLLTARQKRILHEDSLRRAKLIKERQDAVLNNNLKAFEDEARMEKVLASIYRQAQQDILAKVTETIAKVEKAGGEWSYANQSALTRSRGLFEQITEELVKLGQKEQNVFYKELGNIYTDQFLRQVYELGQTMTVKANFNRLNASLIRKTLDYPWSGAMFSDRLWQDKATLGRNLRIGLTQSMILGEGIPQMTDRINKGINTSRYNAERVARTETKRVTYCAHNDAYEDMGVDELEYRCANGGDARTCQYCKADNGKHYKRGEEPTLPRHPNCRCVYIPVVSDTFGDNELNELTGSVRGAENYEKWKEKEAERLKKEAEADKDNKEGKSPKLIELENNRADLQKQVDYKNTELSDIPLKYQAEKDRLEREILEIRESTGVKEAKLKELLGEEDKIKAERKTLRVAYRDGKISDSEYDKRLDKLILQGNELKEKVAEAEKEYYGLFDKLNSHTAELSSISNKIRSETANIQAEILKLTTKIEGIDKEISLYMRYQGYTDSFVDIMASVEQYNIKQKAVAAFPKPKTGEEIIERLAGGDMTSGSCSSLAFSYIGNVNGLDVLDFRGGKSCDCFATNSVIKKIAKLEGVKSNIIMVKKEAADTAKILKGLEKGKEYYLAVGKHAAIVRNTDSGVEYLELQSRYSNGWISFNRYGTMIDTLSKRFGCRKTVDKSYGMVWERSVVLMDVSSFKDNAEFREILSYINTDPDKQKKGAAGHER